jgi:aspartyl-tRNA(Asn)/glutamyl-tRNA(Gln) amidotransferase subunit C
MAVDADTVRRIGRLARIRIDTNDVDGLAGELNGILRFVEQLNEVDIEGVEAMTSVTPMQLRRREDKVTDGNQAEKIVSNAPASEDNFFVVPKVVE